MDWTAIFQKGCNSLFDWGPGMFFAALMIYAAYRLAKVIGIKIMTALEKPAEALNHQANALNRQAESMDRLMGSIEEFVRVDRTEHREIIMLQKVILDRLEVIRNGQSQAGTV